MNRLALWTTVARIGRIAAVAATASFGVCAHALDIDFGNAAAYSAFIFEDVSGANTIGGRLAVGGNLSLVQADIGAGAPALAPMPSLVVRGNITSFASGSISSGSSAGFGLYLGTKAAGTPAGLDLRKVAGLPVDFDAERVYLGVMSEQLRGLPVTGQVLQEPGTLVLSGSNSPVEVFELSATQAASALSVSVRNVPANAHIVVNLKADAVRRIGFALDTAGLAAWKGRVLLNAHDAETVQFSNLTVWASVLAPNACVCNSTGRLEGSVVARKWSAAMGIAYTPFVPKP